MRHTPAIHVLRTSTDARCFYAVALVAVSVALACAPSPEATVESGTMPVDMPGQPSYQLPPQEVVDLLDAPPQPAASVSPDGRWLLLSQRRRMPGIDELAVPVLELAGRLVSPRTNGPYGTRYASGTGFSLIEVEGGDERRLEVPDRGLSAPLWAPDSRRFAFSRTIDAGIELWVAEVDGGDAEALSGPDLNAAMGSGFGAALPCSWMPDSRRLLCHFVPSDRGAPPQESPVPTGPVIQETAAAEAPVWTYQDLLKTPHDEALFDYFMTSQPAFVDVETGETEAFGKPAIYATLDPSPGGAHFLSIRIERPYSYLVPDSRFPRQVEVLDANGTAQHIASLPMNEAGPEHLGWSAPGPRRFSWQNGAPQTLAYLEALDGGNPAPTAEHRDRMLLLEAPFTGEPVELIRSEFRLGGRRSIAPLALWSEDWGIALVTEFDWPTRRSRTWFVEPQEGGRATVLWDLSTDDWYGNPGNPVLKTTTGGERVLLRNGDWIYLTGPGGSPEGDRPFLDRLNLRTRDVERLFRSAPETYESVVAVLDDQASRILTSYETKTEPPNYVFRDIVADSRSMLTDFPHPAPQLAGISVQKVDYVREDGVPLSGELYLPADYEPGTPLPAVVWAYPREFASRAGAGQVRGSPHRFPWFINGASQLLFLTQGYALFNNASMPIVGGAEANDTYVQQLVASGQAAVDVLVEMGVADRHRVGIAGHSYGAFMTANLLANSDIFAAGIARSGAYNRSLTPFGFQNERRTFWQAPQVYFQMSAFMHTDGLKEPILLIHGTNDSNTGTYPIQSERMYHALKGLGGTARLVMLPYENHGYAARESVLHTVWEMFDWFDRYVKSGGRVLTN